MELIGVIMILVILSAIVIREYVYYQQAAIVARNTQNVIEVSLATERFNLSGYSFTNLIPDSLNQVPVETIRDQLIAAGFLYPNPAITSTEILARYYSDPATLTNGEPADAYPGVLFFFPTKDN